MLSKSRSDNLGAFSHQFSWTISFSDPHAETSANGDSLDEWSCWCVFECRCCWHPPPPPSLALLHISLGTSKVLALHFQVGSLWGFSGVSVGGLENCVYLSFAEAFCSLTLLKCPHMESSSVLKRPSDSNSALFSVTLRDRLVYASGTVRSAASSNAPYVDRERETHTSGHTCRHRKSDKTQRDTNSEGAHSHTFFGATQVHSHTHF